MSGKVGYFFDIPTSLKLSLYTIMTFKSATDGSVFNRNKFSLRKLEDKNGTRMYRFYRNIALKSKETVQKLLRNPL